MDRRIFDFNISILFYITLYLTVRCKVSFDFSEPLFEHLKSDEHDISCRFCSKLFRGKISYKRHLASRVCRNNKEKIKTLEKSKLDQSSKRTTSKVTVVSKKQNRKIQNSKIVNKKEIKEEVDETKEEEQDIKIDILEEALNSINIDENIQPEQRENNKAENVENNAIKERNTRKIKKFKYFCAKCEKGFNAFFDIFDHLRRCHDGILDCIFCDDRFPNEYQLLDHIGEHCKSFYCRIHFKAFKTRSELRAHYKVPNHQLECGICSDVLKSRSARYSHRRKHLFPEEEAKCPHCPLVYKHYPNLARHIKTFHMEKTYLCEQCGVSYSTNHALKIHVERDHDGVYEDKKADICCEECGKTFKYIKNLRMHKGTHLGHTEFCRHCHESFQNIEKLNEHMKERGHELFTCEQCSQTFVRRGVYLLHLEKHKYSGDEKMRKKLYPKRRKTIKPSFYSCPYCEKEFKSKIQMKEHARMHSDDKPFKCNVCGKCFKRGPTLYAHKRVHLDYKNYRCKYCDKRFTQPGGLAQHTMIHTGERPHKCEICNKGFITTTSLKKHLETHRKATNLLA